MIEIIGIGPGDERYHTMEVNERIKASEYVIGTERQLKSVHIKEKGIRYDGKLATLKALIETGLTQYGCVSVLASGDPSFYGISTWIQKNFESEQIAIVTGISSLQILFGKLGLSMHDVFLTSLHGREPNWELWTKLPKVGLLTDRVQTPAVIARALLERGLNPKMVVGEWLTYPEEKIEIGFADDFLERQYEFCVVVIDFEG